MKLVFRYFGGSKIYKRKYIFIFIVFSLSLSLSLYIINPFKNTKIQFCDGSESDLKFIPDNMANQYVVRNTPLGKTCTVSTCKTNFKLLKKTDHNVCEPIICKNWSNWSSCNNGKATRTCNDYHTDMTETENCRDCVYSDWYENGSCKKIKDALFQVFNRKILKEPLLNGKKCSTNNSFYTKLEKCNIEKEVPCNYKWVPIGKCFKINDEWWQRYKAVVTSKSCDKNNVPTYEKLSKCKIEDIPPTCIYDESKSNWSKECVEVQGKWKKYIDLLPENELNGQTGEKCKIKRIYKEHSDCNPKDCEYLKTYMTYPCSNRRNFDGSFGFYKYEFENTIEAKYGGNRCTSTGKFIPCVPTPEDHNRPYSNYKPYINSCNVEFMKNTNHTNTLRENKCDNLCNKNSDCTGYQFNENDNSCNLIVGEFPKSTKTSTDGGFTCYVKQ